MINDYSLLLVILGEISIVAFVIGMGLYSVKHPQKKAHSQ